MDPKACLEEAATALNKGWLQVAEDLLAEYDAWRVKGGFEPEWKREQHRRGDQWAHILHAQLKTARENDKFDYLLDRMDDDQRTPSYLKDILQLIWDELKKRPDFRNSTFNVHQEFNTPASTEVPHYVALEWFLEHPKEAVALSATKPVIIDDHGKRIAVLSAQYNELEKE